MITPLRKYWFAEVSDITRNEVAVNVLNVIKSLCNNNLDQKVVIEILERTKYDVLTDIW